MHDGAFPLSLSVTLSVLAGALLYTASWVRCFRVEPEQASWWRLASFLSGLLVLWIALGSPLSQMDHHALSAHMLQHLLVMNLAAPLLLLGAPFAVLTGGQGASASAALERGARSAVGRFFGHPVVTWLLATAVVVGWHLPRVLELTLKAPVWHTLQHASFLLAGFLFWWPVVRPWPAIAVWPRWALPLYLFAATLPCDALAAFLAFSGRVVYPHYLAVHADSRHSALADQATAGALMWCVVTVGYLLPAVLITLGLLSPKRHVGEVPAA